MKSKICRKLCGVLLVHNKGLKMLGQCHEKTLFQLGIWRTLGRESYMEEHAKAL